ncbi:MAG: RluA family pseudouridine synthase [Candidatus Kapabacteria bacterium]|nr:RluA family pseudouridine synthase [Candidatus Kapabacteria bacterium]
MKPHQKNQSSSARQQPTKPDILFEDEHILVLAKPAGLLTLPDRFNQALPNLRTMLVERYGTIFVVHRIDRETSGVMLFCKTAEAHKALSEQFETRSVRKIYHALAQGRFEQEELAIDIPLHADPARPGLMSPSVRGKESLTHVRVLKRFRMATLLECELITGRQHQIRVHCAAVGHPLLVDKDYGGLDEFMLSSVKRKYNVGKHEEEKPLMTRTTLHAFSMTFTHPATQEAMSFEAPYPKDFKALLQALDKYASYKNFALPSAARGEDVSDWQEFLG